MSGKSADALENMLLMTFAGACGALLLVFIYAASGARSSAPQALFALLFLEATLLLVLARIEKMKPETQQAKGSLVYGIAAAVALVLSYVLRYGSPPFLNFFFGGANDLLVQASRLETGRMFAFASGTQAAAFSIFAGI